MDRHDLDQTDRKILDLLQRNGGLSNAELADAISLSPSPCSRRVRLLEEAGFFRGKVALIDPVKVGLPVSVFVHVSLDEPIKKTLNHFEAEIEKCDEVMECYLMTGDFDYLLRVAVTDLFAYQRFLEEKLTVIKGVSSIRSSFSLKQVRYQTALPLSHLSTKRG